MVAAAPYRSRMIAPTPINRIMKTCPECGSLNDDRADFCSLCLTSLSGGASACREDLAGKPPAEAAAICGVCVTRFTCAESLHLAQASAAGSSPDIGETIQTNSFEPTLGTGPLSSGLGLASASDETTRRSDQFKDLARVLGESDPENQAQSYIFQKAVYVIWAIIAILIYFSPLREILF